LEVSITKKRCDAIAIPCTKETIVTLKIRLRNRYSTIRMSVYTMVSY